MHHAFDAIISRIVSMKMLLFSLAFIILFTFNLNECESGGSTTLTLGRSQSMSAAMRETLFKPLQRNQAELESGSSLHEAESRASTSRIEEPSLREHEPLMENTRQVSFTPNVDLSEVSLPTDNGMNLNPARDGVFAQVQRVILRSLAPAAVGLAVGAGAAELIDSTLLIKSTTPIATEPEEINVIG